MKTEEDKFREECVDLSLRISDVIEGECFAVAGNTLTAQLVELASLAAESDLPLSDRVNYLNTMVEAMRDAASGITSMITVIVQEDGS